MLHVTYVILQVSTTIRTEVSNFDHLHGCGRYYVIKPLPEICKSGDNAFLSPKTITFQTKQKVQTMHEVPMGLNMAMHYCTANTNLTQVTKYFFDIT